MNWEVKSPVEKESDSNNIAFEQLIKAIKSNIVFDFIGANNQKSESFRCYKEFGYSRFSIAVWTENKHYAQRRFVVCSCR